MYISSKAEVEGQNFKVELFCIKAEVACCYVIEIEVRTCNPAVLSHRAAPAPPSGYVQTNNHTNLFLSNNKKIENCAATIARFRGPPKDAFGPEKGPRRPGKRGSEVLPKAPEGPKGVPSPKKWLPKCNFRTSKLKFRISKLNFFASKLKLTSKLKYGTATLLFCSWS